MIQIQNHMIKKTELGYSIVLYLDPVHTEFADELGKQNKDNQSNLKSKVLDYIHEKSPNIKFHTAIVMLGSFIVASVPVGATPTTATVQPSTQKYTVVSGDTLWLIAQKFNTTVDAIKSGNNLTTDVIYVGQTLIIPLANAQTPVQQVQDYRVVAGDTLWNLANRFNTTINTIKSINNLTSDTLFVGQILKIPVTNTVTLPSTPPPPTTETGSLSQGMRSEAVSLLQQQLQSLGYFTYPTITGYYGSVTAQSIRDFQQAYGIPVTGIADKTTQDAIQRAVVKKRLVEDSKNYISVPYVWGSANPKVGFDCSGFVYYMFDKHGVNTTRTTSSDLFKQGTPIQRANMQPGDLVFFAVNKPGEISHVGFYLGDNQFISATSSKGIWVYSMDNSYWKSYYVGAKEYIKSYNQSIHSRNLCMSAENQ